MEHAEYWLHEKENPQRVVEEQLELIKEKPAKLRPDFGKNGILQLCYVQKNKLINQIEVQFGIWHHFGMKRL